MRIRKRFRILSVLLCIAVLMSFSITFAFAEGSEATAEKKVVTAASTEKLDSAEKNFAPNEEGNEDSDDVSAQDLLANQDALKAASKDSFFIDGEPGYEDDYIDWNGEEDFILYRGDMLQLDFSVHDTWKEYNTIPAFDIWSLESDEAVFTYNPADADLIVSADDWDNYKAQIDISSAALEPGYYFIAIQAMPCNSEGAWAEDLSGFEIPEEYVDFTVKERP